MDRLMFLITYGVTPEVDKKLVVYIPRGYDRLATVDPMSYQILIYTKINPGLEAKLNIKHPKWKFFLIYPKVISPTVPCHCPIYALENILQMETDLDAGYNRYEKSRIWAYKSMLICLKRAAFLTYWGLAENIDVSIDRYSKGISPFVRWFYVWRVRRQMTRLVRDMCIRRDVAEVLEEAVREAKYQLYDYMCMVDDKPYVMGDYPCSLDVFVCSLVYPLIHMNFPENIMHHSLTHIADGALKDYVDRFMLEFGSLQEVEADVVEADRAPTYVLIGAGACVVLTMAGFAYMYGLLK